MLGKCEKCVKIKLIQIEIIPWLISTVTKKATLRTKIIFDIFTFCFDFFTPQNCDFVMSVKYNCHSIAFYSKNFSNQIIVLECRVCYLFRKVTAKLFFHGCKLVIDKLDVFNISSKSSVWILTNCLFIVSIRKVNYFALSLSHSLHFFLSLYFFLFDH